MGTYVHGSQQWEARNGTAADWSAAVRTVGAGVAAIFSHGAWSMGIDHGKAPARHAHQAIAIALSPGLVARRLSSPRVSPRSPQPAPVTVGCWRHLRPLPSARARPLADPTRATAPARQGSWPCSGSSGCWLRDRGSPLPSASLPGASASAVSRALSSCGACGQCCCSPNLFAADRLTCLRPHHPRPPTIPRRRLHELLYTPPSPPPASPPVICLARIPSAECHRLAISALAAVSAFRGSQETFPTIRSQQRTACSKVSRHLVRPAH